MSSITDQFYIRQKDIINKLRLSKAVVIGCGASGSCIGILLAKLGCPFIELWDGDLVEDHNMPNQYFPETSLGENKAEALKKVIFDFTPPELKPSVIAHPEYYVDEEINNRIVFMCVDGLDTRRSIFQKLLTYDVNWIIDTRMGAEYYEVHTVNMKDDDDIRSYYQTLEGEAMPLPCTGRSVIYNVMSMSSIAISLYVKMLRKRERDHIPRKITYDFISYNTTKQYRDNDDPTIIL